MSENALVEVLNIVITTLEKHEGHSARVAKLVKEVSGARESKPKEVYANVLAAYLHDCCMNSPKHLTLLHFDSDDDAPLLKKYAQSSQRLFEKANLPEEVYTALTHTFERYDGRGLPDGLKREEIPQGARMIAVADAYVHLITFERNGSTNGNPHREALAVIKRLGTTCFDPEVVDALENVIIDRLVDKNSPRVLIINSGLEEVEPLAKELKKNGIRPYLSQNTDEAKDILQRSSITVILSALNTRPLDGLSFYRSIKGEERLKSIPFLLGSENDDQSTVERARTEGVADVIKKPYDVEDLVVKIKNHIQQASRKNSGEAVTGTAKKGLSGNLDEIQLVDLIQMFLRGRKTGLVKLTKEEEHGEVFFDKGQVIEARYNGLGGVDAFNQLIRWQGGLFVFYPQTALPEPNIDVGTESLLMEAYWIWDEEAVTT
jgi:response regulator RpfG family c-di-GMP phosphodiesterase